MGDDRPGAYLEGRRGVEKAIYRASFIGSCLRHIVALWTGYGEARGEAATEMLMAAAEAGNEYEGAVVQWLTELGFVFESRQTLVEIEVIKNVYLRGHTDGIALKPIHPPAMFKDIKTESVLLEVKSMSENQFKRWKARGKRAKFGSFFKYACQITTYMQGSPELDVLYVVVERDNPDEKEDERNGLRLIRTPYEQVVWAAKNGKVDITIIPAGKPPIPWAKVKARVIKAESWRKRSGGELPKCDTEDKWFCPVWYLHDEDEPIVPADELTDEMLALIEEIVEKRQEFAEVAKEGKKADDERKRIDKELMNLMGEVDQTGIVGKEVDYLVTIVKGGGEKAKKEKMIEDMGEEKANEYFETYEYKYVKVTPKKKG